MDVYDQLSWTVFSGPCSVYGIVRLLAEIAFIVRCEMRASGPRRAVWAKASNKGEGIS